MFALVMTFAALPVHTPAAVSFPRAVFSFSRADFPVGPFSHGSSLLGVPLKARSACLMWHLITAPQALQTALRAPFEHLREVLLSGAQPGSSPPKGSPGAASATPATRTIP